MSRGAIKVDRKIKEAIDLYATAVRQYELASLRAELNPSYHNIHERNEHRTILWKAREILESTIEVGMESMLAMVV